MANEIIKERKNLEREINIITNFDEKKTEEKERKTYEKTLIKTFQKIEEEYQRKDNEEIVQVRALASLGLIVSSFSHELKEIRDNSSEIKSLGGLFSSLITKDLEKAEEYKDAIDILELLDENSEKIKHWIDYSLTAIKKDKRKRKPLDFSDYFIKLKKSWKKVFQTKDIKFTIIDNLKDIDYHFRAFEMDMNTIFTNLINNSIDSFNKRDHREEIKKREICIITELIKDNIVINYSDNGIGLSNVFEDNEEIFLPFTTTKKNGTGLGMYLVKDVIDDNNGSISVLDPNSGFSVNITFPTRRK
ncbi:MAG: HAMP domain-containing histidine kinase [Candidatus Cloacimonetes bacterium]|nr:HAMP domain-containing histidine kinase [Candidatus Cloacimonadota bacterium]MBT6994633.1 HAMP domain-containing histidine kinase [Candidatus Cloacimonadota bacterium]